jgi:putative protease
MKPDGSDLTVTVAAITDENGEPMESCPHPKQKIYVNLGVALEPFDLLRRKD